MSNRYNTLLQDRYVSTYVPLPLEQISGLAEDYTNKYNTGKNLPKQFDLLTQKINAAPGDYNNKDILIKDYKSKIDDLVNNAKSEDYAKPEYQDKIKNLTLEFAKDPRLQSIINNKHTYDTQYVPYLNSKESKEDLVLTDIQDKDNPNTGYKAHSSGYKQLKPGEILKPLDYVKYERSIDGVKTIMDNIAVKGVSLSSIGQWSKDGNYFIDTDGHRKEVSKEDVYNVALANIGNYAENTQGKFRFKTLLQQTGLDPHMNYTEFMYNDKIPKKLKEGIDKELTKDLYNYGTKQIFEDTDIKYNLKDNVIKQHNAKKLSDAQDAIGIPQTAPDTENIENLTKEIPKDIQHIFAYEKQSDGSYKSKFNPDQFGENTYKGFMGGKNYIKTGEGSLKPQISKAWDYLYNAAKAVGINTKNLSLNNKQQVEDILNQYMEYSKNISPQEIIQGPQQDIISNNIINDRQNYTIKDADGIVVTNSKMPDINEKNFNATARTYKDGKQIIKAQYQNDNGEIVNYTVIPHSNQSNDYYGTVGSIKENMQKFFTQGKSNEDSKPLLKIIENKMKSIAEKNNQEFVSFDSPKYKGPKPIDVKKIPGSNNYIMVLADKDNRKDFHNYLYNDDTGKSESIGGGLDGLEQFISTNWYSNTPEGNAEALQLNSGSGQFKGITGK